MQQLGELVEISTGTKRNLEPDGSIAYVNGGVKPSGYVRDSNTAGNSITIPSRGSVGHVGYQKEDYWCGPLSYRIISKDESTFKTKYLFFALKNSEIYIKALQQTGSIPALNKAQLVNFRVAVPPIEVQQEIVRILDTFTELEAELVAELEARKKQYEYYRNNLLTFPEQGGVRWVPMGSVGQFIRGNGMLKNTLKENGLPAIHYGQVHTFYGSAATETKSFVEPSYGNKLRKATPGNLVIATTAEDIEGVGKSVAWLGETEAAVSGDAFIYAHTLDPLYVSYFFQSEHFHKQKLSKITGTKVKRISGDSLAKILIPVPALDVQKDIGFKLSNFDSLVGNLEFGLPAEIRTRRIQYEFYRDKLLTFKEIA